MVRYLRIPLGQRGAFEDNRHQLAALGLLPPGESATLGDDVQVPVPLEILSYPHLYVTSRASQCLAVRVMASTQPGVGGVALTVASGLSADDAVQLVRAIQAAIADPMAAPGKYGMLE